MFVELSHDEKYIEWSHDEKRVGASTNFSAWLNSTTFRYDLTLKHLPTSLVHKLFVIIQPYKFFIITPL
jgi:hypothetical protein